MISSAPTVSNTRLLSSSSTVEYGYIPTNLLSQYSRPALTSNFVETPHTSSSLDLFWERYDHDNRKYGLAPDDQTPLPYVPSLPPAPLPVDVEIQTASSPLLYTSLTDSSSVSTIPGASWPWLDHHPPLIPPKARPAYSQLYNSLPFERRPSQPPLPDYVALWDADTNLESASVPVNLVGTTSTRILRRNSDMAYLDNWEGRDGKRARINLPGRRATTGSLPVIESGWNTGHDMVLPAEAIGSGGGLTMVVDPLVGYPIPRPSLYPQNHKWYLSAQGSLQLGLNEYRNQPLQLQRPESGVRAGLHLASESGPLSLQSTLPSAPVFQQSAADITAQGTYARRSDRQSNGRRRAPTRPRRTAAAIRAALDAAEAKKPEVCSVCIESGVRGGMIKVGCIGSHWICISEGCLEGMSPFKPDMTVLTIRDSNSSPLPHLPHPLPLLQIRLRAPHPSHHRRRRQTPVPRHFSNSHPPYLLLPPSPRTHFSLSPLLSSPNLQHFHLLLLPYS